MQTIAHVSKKAEKYIKRELSRKLPLNDIMDLQENVSDFVSGWLLPSRINIFYKCASEMKMGTFCFAYYYYKQDKPHKRKIIFFIDKFARAIKSKNRKGPLSVYVGATLVHELCHVQDFCNKIPIAYKEFDPKITEQEKKLIPMYEFLYEANAEEKCMNYLYSQGIKYLPTNIFKAYGYLLKGFNSPKYTYSKIARLINVSRLILGNNWYDKVSLNPPNMDDFNHPEDYAESLL